MGEAEARQLVDRLSLTDLIERHPHSRGVATLRSIVADASLGLALTRSDLEHAFLVLVDDAGLPRPEVNTILRLGSHSLEVDCLWRAPRVIVELDGHRFHSTRAAFENDRERDRRLAVAGWRVIRITWRQLQGRPGPLAADLAAPVG